MTLSDFATFSTAISGMAVTVSLVYLIIQTRQSARHTRALVLQGASARTTAIVLANQAQDRTAAWLQGNHQEPTPEAVKRMQFLLMCESSLIALEDLFSQHSDGLMKQEVFARNCRLHGTLLSQPGYREVWYAQRADQKKIAPKFAAFVDGLCVEEATEFKFTL